MYVRTREIGITCNWHVGMELWQISLTMANYEFNYGK